MTRKLPKGDTALSCLVLSCADLLEPAFYLEQLVVACWNVFPEQFAMREFPNYPDAHKVLSALFADRGTIRRGWIAPIGRKGYHQRRQYRITVEGRQKIKEMETRDG